MYTPVYNLVIHTQDGGCSGLCTHLYTTWSHTQDGGCSGLCTHLYTTWSGGLVLSTESYHFNVHIEQQLTCKSSTLSQGCSECADNLCEWLTCAVREHV